MTIQWQLWRIRSTEYGFQVERKINPTRWKTEFYYNTLAQACKGLLEYRIHAETADIVINAMNTASARISTAKLVKKIDDIAKEVLEGIRHAN